MCPNPIFSRTSDWLSILRVVVEGRSFEKINLFMWNWRNQVFGNWDSSDSIEILHASYSRYRCWYLDLHTQGTFDRFITDTLIYIFFRRPRYGRLLSHANEKSKFDLMAFHQCHWQERHQVAQWVAILSRREAHSIWVLLMGWELMGIWD